MLKFFSLAIPAILLSLNVLHAADGTKGWLMNAANPQRTSWVPEEVKGKLKPEWFKVVPTYISRKVQIIAVDGKILIAASDGLYAYDAENGDLKWHFKTELPLGNSPTVSGNTAYVGGTGGKVFAIDIKKGKKKWIFDAEAGFNTNPLVINGLVYLGSKDGNFYAIKADTGKLSWKYDVGAPIKLSAAYKDGDLYFAAEDARAYCLNAKNGKLKWKSKQFPCKGFRSYWPVIYGDYVIYQGLWQYNNQNKDEADFLYDRKDANGKQIKIKNGQPIGEKGTEPGKWLKGTPTINVKKIAKYLETKPYRRTYIVVDRKTGKEKTWDFDKNGKTDYPPFAFIGSKDGTRYPPVIGKDGVLYQRQNTTSNQYIPRGTMVGWKFGTTINSIASKHLATDEPSAQSMGGNIMYIKLLGEREAGYVDLSTTPFKWSSMHHYGHGSLAQLLPDLMKQGWPYSYWKHGDQAPMVPYKGRVYELGNNALIAYSTKGTHSVVEYDQGRGTGYPLNKTIRKGGKYVPGLYGGCLINKKNQLWLLMQETFWVQTPDRTNVPNMCTPYGLSASEKPVVSTDIKNKTYSSTITLKYPDTELKVYLSKLHPTQVITSGSKKLLLESGGNFSGVAYLKNGKIKTVPAGKKINAGEISSSWILIWNDMSKHRWLPYVVSFRNKLTSIDLSSKKLALGFDKPVSIGMTPFRGLSAPVPGEGPIFTSKRNNTELQQWLTKGIPEAIAKKAGLINELAENVPMNIAESYSVEANNDVKIKYQYSDFKKLGNKTSSTSIIPPVLALAAWKDGPIKIEAKVTDLDYPLPMGRLALTKSPTHTVNALLPGLANVWKSKDKATVKVTINKPAVQQKLIKEIRKIIAAGHLRPAKRSFGIMNNLYNRAGEYLWDYNHSPGETINTLIRALPFLPPKEKAETEAYIKEEFKNYPPTKIVHTGFGKGTFIEYSLKNHDFEASLKNGGKNAPPSSPQTSVRWSMRGWKFTPMNYYAIWQYAKKFGGSEQLFKEVGNKLTPPIFPISMPYILNGQITGRIGYIKLAELAKKQADKKVVKELIDLLILRVALFKNPESLKKSGFEYGGYKWTVQAYMPDKGIISFHRLQIGTIWSQYELYGKKYDILYMRAGAGTGGAYSFTIDFLNLCPELGRFINQYNRKEAETVINTYSKMAPFWFVSEAEEMAGEGTIQPLQDTLAWFQARHQVLGQSSTELEKYLDVPAFKVGDLYYIQNLCATLEAKK